MPELKRILHQLFLGDMLFRLLPIRKDRFLFTSFYGLHYSDGPRAISERLHEAYPEAEIYWAFTDDAAHELPSYVRPLSMDSVVYYRVKATAGAIISNVFIQGAYLSGSRRRDWLTRLHLRLENRRKQISVTTWHGTPYKKMGKDQVGAAPQSFVCNQPCYYLVGNRFEEERMMHLTDGQLTPLHFGSPRVANAVHPNPARVAEIRARLGLLPEERVILYAPTFRSGPNGPEPERSGLSQLAAFSVSEADKALRAHLGWKQSWKLFCRFHNYVERAVDWSSIDPAVRNGNELEDIADYYLVADIVVTDYSSVMFDAMQAGIPVLLLCPDLSTYLNQERGLYFRPEELPFPTINGWEALGNGLARLNSPAYREAVAAFMDSLGCYKSDGVLDRIAAFLMHVEDERRDSLP